VAADRVVQTCVVHLIRNTFRLVGRQDWEEFVPFLDYDVEIRQMI
jgi:transposase-like protein